MICPNCKQEIKLPVRATFNADQYGTTNTTVTNCCGRIVWLIPIRAYRVEPSDVLQDDWGFDGKPYDTTLTPPPA